MSLINHEIHYGAKIIPMNPCYPIVVVVVDVDVDVAVAVVVVKGAQGVFDDPT